MAIKSVTQANLAEVVAEKRGQGATIASEADVARMALGGNAAPEPKPASKIVGMGAETLNPEPALAENPQRKADRPAEEKDDKENPFAKRISQLTKEKRELEEFAEGEYNARLQIQRRIEDLEKQIKPPEPKVETDPEPDPEKYADQKLFLKDWGAWNRRTAVKESQEAAAADARRAEAERIQAELNERSQQSVAAARKEFSDFDERLKRSPVPWDKLPPHIKATLMESEYGAHALYTLLADPKNFQKVLGLRPGAAVLELGKLVAKFSDKPVETPEEGDKPQPAPVVTTSRAPAPMPPLTSSGDVPITWDPSKPQPFADYKRRKLDENRRKRGH